MNVRLVAVTPDAEKLIAYCARVSSPKQDNPKIDKLIEYCIKHKHWSIFEMANMVVEIVTSRAIAQQILRHRSFSFQEFSQRYAEAQAFEQVKPRRQDVKNRQNSVDDLGPETRDWFAAAYEKITTQASELYQEALTKNIAKESARFLLPLHTQTKLYMNGNIRSWIHYIELRSGHGTQKEHQDIALAIKEIFKQQLPIISAALEWTNDSTT